MSTTASQDNVQQHIDRLFKLVDQGMISNQDLLASRADSFSSNKGANKSGSSEEEEHELKIKREKKVKDALKDQRRYRARKSSETLKIRNMVKVLMKRRFELQCAIEDSILFGKSPPKRLDEGLFDRACASPLSKIFTCNPTELVNVRGKKQSDFYMPVTQFACVIIYLLVCVIHHAFM